MSSTIAVVGGGMAGIAVALRLADAGHEVMLYEAAAGLGGLASPWTVELADGTSLVWDRHYHVTLTSDATTRALLGELGLGDDLRWAKARTGYTDGGGVVAPADTPADFLRLPGLSLVAKVRIGATMWWGSRIRDGASMERVLVDDWLRRWSGRAGFERFWLPLLRAKLGDNHRVTSAAFIWATIARLYRSRRAGVAQDEFGWVPGGYATTVARAADVLAERGVEVRTATPVAAVGAAPDDDGPRLEVRLADGEVRRVDHAVVTAAAPVAARLCVGLDAEEHRRLDGVTYQGIVCASVVLDGPVTDDYLTYVTDPASPFTAVVAMTALTGPEALGGHHLVYLPKYVTSDDPFLEATDAEVRASFLPYLRRLFPDTPEVLAFQVSRVRHVMAVTTLRYSDHVPPTRTSVPGLWLASSANIVNGTLNVDETVSLALGVADRVLAAAGAGASAGRST